MVKATAPFDSDVSGVDEGARAERVSPRPTSCALLDDGEMVDDGVDVPVVVRSADQSLTRCTEVSKLLRTGDERQNNISRVAHKALTLYTPNTFS